MRLAFMGTPEFAVPALSETLAAGHDIAAVYTKAPQPAGRGQRLRKSPVHRFAESHDLEVRTPKNFKASDEKEFFEALRLDTAIVVAYGVILPPPILDAPRLGCLNLHASLLPRWRGAAPIHRAIMAGDKETGVQVMRMEASLDTGPILLSEVTPIHPGDTTATLHDRLAIIGASLLPRTLSALDRGALTETPQTDQGITYAHKVESSETKLDWSRSAVKLDAHIRGLSPFPGAWFELTINSKVQRVKALMSSLDSRSGEPGEVLQAAERLVIACGGGAVNLSKVQREGKGAQTAEDFLRGANLSVGDILK